MASASRHYSRFVAVAGLVLALTACSDSATAPEANLTQAEAAEVLEALSAITGLVGGDLRADGGATLFDQPAVTESIDESFPCPAGGNARVRGSFTFNESNGSSSVDLRFTYSNCAAEAPSGRTWTFNGDPDVRQRLSGSTNPSTGNFTLTGSQVGAIRFNNGSQSGRCSINLTTRFSDEDLVYRVYGTVCGQDVSKSG